MNKGNTTNKIVKLSANQLLLMGLAVVLFAVNLPAMSTIVSTAVLFVFTYGVIKLCQNKVLTAFVAIPIGGILLLASPAVYEQLIYTVSLFFGILGATAIGGFMLGENKSSILLYLAALVAAFVGIFAYTGNISSACSVLITLPGAAALALCNKKNLPRVSTVCAVSAAFIFSVFAPSIIAIVSEYGAESLTHIGTSLEALRKSLTEMLITMGSTLGEPYSELYSPKAADAMTRLTFDVLPAIAIIGGNLVAFFSQTCYYILKNRFVRPVSPKERMIVMSKTSAWMFIISLVLVFITSFIDGDKAEILSISMTNLNMILMPSFFIIAIFALLAWVQSKRSKPSMFTIILIVFLIFNFGSMLTYPLSVFGAITAIRLPQTPTTADTSEKNS